MTRFDLLLYLLVCSDSQKGIIEVYVNNFHIFIIRAILGAVFAVILSRFFYPQANMIYVLGLGVILVGLAYLAEYFRKKRTQDKQ